MYFPLNFHGSGNEVSTPETSLSIHGHATFFAASIPK